jgi:hypothetical protein
MKTTGLRNSLLLVAVRELVQDFLAFLRFTEADACALLSAHGFHAFEVDRLQNSRNEQKETGGRLGKASHRHRVGEPPGPIPIGVHPDFTRANWPTASRNQMSPSRRVANHSQLPLITFAPDCMRLDFARCPVDSSQLLLFVVGNLIGDVRGARS